MKVIIDSAPDSPLISFTPEERFALAAYLKSAQAFGVPKSQAAHDLVSELLPHLEKP